MNECLPANVKNTFVIFDLIYVHVCFLMILILQFYVSMTKNIFDIIICECRWYSTDNGKCSVEAMYEQHMVSLCVFTLIGFIVYKLSSKSLQL